MPHTDIITGKEARDKMLEGINTVANAVRVTLGPQGRHVTIQTQPGQPPIVTKDGATVAKHIRSLKDPYADIGAQIIKQSAFHTAGIAGDGTTTATILAQGLMCAGAKAVNEGANPMDIKTGMEIAAGLFVKRLQEMSLPVTADSDMIKHVAIISSNNDEEMGSIVTEAVRAVGQDGLISWANSQTEKTYVVKSSGVEIDQGFKDVRFINNTKQNIVQFENALIMLCPKKISLLREIEPVLTIAMIEKRPILIISDDIDSEAFVTLTLNRSKGFPVCAIKLPGFGANQKDFLQDVAIATGGTIMGTDNGLEPASIKLEHLGTAATVIVTRSNTTLIGVGGDQEAIDSRAEQIKNFLISAESHPTEKRLLEKRLAKLLGSTATIHIGASTDIEREEKKFRIEDALCATRAAMAEGVVAGGGSTMLKIALEIHKSMPFGNIGLDIVCDVLGDIQGQLIKNSGADVSVILPQVAESGNNIGYNAKTHTVCDLLEAGVIDPAKVVRTALMNAVSVTNVFLTTEAAMIEVQ